MADASPTYFGAILTDQATHLEMALFDEAGANIRRAHRRSPAPLTPEALIKSYEALASELIQATELRPSGAALALEGSLDASRGMIIALPSSPAWSDFPLGERLAMALDMPARIDTITNAALMAELMWGAGMGSASAVYLDTSRTITAALFLNGSLVHSPHVGDVGHLPVAPAGRSGASSVRCACGGYGHLSTVASAQSLVRMMIGRLVEAPKTEADVMAITGGRVEALTAPQIWQMACEGDSIARDLMDVAVMALAIAVNFLFLTLDVEHVIVGGTLALCGVSWLATVREQMALLAPPNRAADLADRVVLSDLGPAVILRGVGAIAQTAI